MDNQGMFILWTHLMLRAAIGDESAWNGIINAALEQSARMMPFDPALISSGDAAVQDELRAVLSGKVCPNCGDPTCVADGAYVAFVVLQIILGIRPTRDAWDALVALGPQPCLAIEHIAAHSLSVRGYSGIDLDDRDDTLDTLRHVPGVINAGRLEPNAYFVTITSTNHVAPQELTLALLAAFRDADLDADDLAQAWSNEL